MDMEKILQSLVPVKGVFSDEQIAEMVANETPLQKQFDNRVGPSVDGSPTIDYHVFSPAKKGDTAKYPVLIWLHGMSQGARFREPIRGTDVANFASLEFQAKFGGGAYVVVPRANEDLGMYATEGFLFTNSWLSGYDATKTAGPVPELLMNAIESGRQIPPSQMPELAAALRQFLSEEEANVDLSRVYLAGFSAGGYMTWQTMLAMPDVFAAAVPICQAHIVPTDDALQTISNIPLWVICGEKDYLYGLSVAPTIERLTETHTADLRVTIFENVYNPDRTPAEDEHFSWVPVTFDMFYNDGKPYDEKYPKGFIDWLMSHKK